LGGEQSSGLATLHVDKGGREEGRKGRREEGKKGGREEGR
jgi:hypothetical protein